MDCSVVWRAYFGSAAQVNIKAAFDVIFPANKLTG